MVNLPLSPLNSRQADGLNRRSQRSFKRALAIALATLAAASLAGLLVTLWESGALLQPLSTAALPGDLFKAPQAPQPNIVVQYVAPRSQRTAPIVRGATPANGGSRLPQASPSPSHTGDGGGGDD